MRTVQTAHMYSDDKPCKIYPVGKDLRGIRFSEFNFYYLYLNSSSKIYPNDLTCIYGGHFVSTLTHFRFSFFAVVMWLSFTRCTFSTPFLGSLKFEDDSDLIIELSPVDEVRERRHDHERHELKPMQKSVSANALTLLIQAPGTLYISPYLNLYLIETPFNAFANRADPDQAALLRAV